jgi:hypothetical protein
MTLLYPSSETKHHKEKCAENGGNILLLNKLLQV